MHLFHVRQDVTETLLESFFEVQSVVSTIDDEINHDQHLQDELLSRRDRGIKYNNILNFGIQGTLSMISGGLAFPTGTRFQKTAGDLAIVAGATGTSLAVYALKQNQGPKVLLAPNPNMLTQVFSGLIVEGHEYPDSVWKYLSDSPTGTTLTRRELLINKWVHAKRIGSLTSKRGKQDIDILTGLESQTVSIDILNNRIIMLSELRTAISQMSRDILSVMKSYKHPRSQ